jgi:hypothetical protein
MTLYTKSQIPELLESGLHYHRAAPGSGGGNVGSGRNVRRRLDRFVVRSHAEDDQTTGELRLRKFIQKLYEGYVYKAGVTIRPEKFQVEMLKMVIPTLAKNIVGAAWQSIGSRISREFGWTMKKQPKLFLGMAPRTYPRSIPILLFLAFMVFVIASNNHMYL